MRIFISSTFRDLRPERQAAADALRQAQLVPWGIELFVSEPSTPLDVALRELRLSDAVVLIIGFKAGSLIPENPELTYTAAEFRLARELGKPLWVVIQTEGGEWRNKETTQDLKAALDDFKTAVLQAAVTPAYFENPDQLQVQLLLALTRWQSDGRPGARLTFTTIEEFFAPYRSPIPRLFDFNQTLQGRAEELEALDTFGGSPEQVVAVLTGRGGIGKSKLLHDWAGSLANARVLYVRDDAVWHPEAAKEIPSGDVVIVADDANRFDFLDKLVVLARNLKQRQDIRLVLSIRPSATSQIDAALSARFEPNQICRFPQLERVRHPSVMALARESLGAAHLQYAPALAAVSADTPLVTVVGGRLIARGDISPALLANEEDFRHQVFDRFATEYERLLPAGAINWRSLLNLIAAVGPLAPDAQSFLNPTAQILRLRPDEILQAIDRLEQHGLLLRGGRSVRIVPDLLSDFLLEGACLTRAGDSTGFADLVFRSFQPDHLSNILRNLGELDWRITQRDDARGTRLLDQIWTEINHSFEVADAGGRVQIFESLKEAALFQPSRVIGLIRRAMQTEATPTDLLADWKITQENVVRTIPALLRPIGFHLEHFEEAVNILWYLAQRDNRAADRSPEHARQVLEDLAQYERYKPVTFNLRMADFATSLSLRDGAFDKAFTPLNITNKLLAKEGEFTESEGFTFSFGGFALHYPTVSPVREKAIALIESCLNSENAKVALRSVGSLSHILSGFLPAVVRQASTEEHNWQNEERQAALRIIEARLRERAPIPLVRQIRSMLRQVRPRTKETPVGQRIDKVLSSIPLTDELLVFDAFCTGGWEHDAEFNTIEEADRARQESVLRGVEIFRRKHADAHQQVEALVRLLGDAESCGIDLGSKPFDFINELCTDLEFLDEFLAYLLNDAHPLLAQMIYIPLRRLRDSDPVRYRDSGVRAAGHSNWYIGYGAANAVCYGPSLVAPVPADLAILELLSQHPNVNVRHSTFTGIRRIGTHPAYERNAVNMLLRSDVGDDPRMADDMCSAVTYAGIKLDHLHEADINGLLKKLIPTKEINAHHVELFLAWVGQNHPAALCEFIISRLDRYSGMRSRDESTTGYAPVPHHRLGNAFHALQGSPQYGDFLVRVRDRFVSQSDHRYWLRELFWAIGTIDKTTLCVLDELLHSDDRGTASAAADLLAEAPRELAFARPHFAIHVIENCERFDDELGKRAISMLIGNAYSGSFNRVAGQPSPQYLSMRERAAALRDNFPSDSTGWVFFSRLYDSAVAMLERERLDDEEIRSR